MTIPHEIQDLWGTSENGEFDLPPEALRRLAEFIPDPVPEPVPELANYDIPLFKDLAEDCDPQYCYTWKSGVAWMPGDYACDASGQLWQCNQRQDVAQHCTEKAPVYDSPDSLDEELVWALVQKPSIPAPAPQATYRDCTIHDSLNEDARYFW